MEVSVEQADRQGMNARLSEVNAELQRRVHELERLLAVIPIGIGIAEDPACRSIRVNPQFAAMLGISLEANASLTAPEEQRPSNFRVYHDGQEIAPDQLPLQVAAATGASVSDIELEVVRDDGTTLTLLECATPLFDEHGAVRGSVGAFLDITARKQTEAALRRQAELLELSYDAIFVRDMQSVITYWNRGATTLYGWGAEEAYGRVSHHLLATRFAESLAEPVDHWLVREGDWEGEITHRRRDGADVVVDSHQIVVWDEHGAPVAILETNRDITARKQVELALRASEARTRAILATAPDAVITIDHEGRVIEFNPAAEQIFGYSRAEAAGRLLGDLIVPPALRQAHHDGLARYLATGASMVVGRRIELTGMRANGQEFPVELAIAAIPIDGGPPLFTGFVRDITAREQADTALRAAVLREQQRAGQLRRLAEASLAINSAASTDDVLSVITEQARDIIGAHQAVTSLTAGNGRARAIITVSLSEQYAGRRPHAAAPNGSGVDAPAVGQHRPPRLTRQQLEGHPAWQEFGGGAAEPPPLRGWLAAPLIGRDGSNLGQIQLSDKLEGEFNEEDEAVATQLAQLASVAIENVRLHEQTHDALRARNEFLSGVSHDLKTPIATIKGQAQLLARRLRRGAAGHPGPLIDGLESIDATANKMTLLLNELVDVARLQAGQELDLQRRPVDLVALVRRECDEARQTTERHQIVMESDGPELLGEWDGGRLSRVIANLLSNALKFSPNGGLVTVTLGREPATSTDGGWAVLRVRDRGVGIPPAELSLIFERFQRGSNVTGRIEGSGIGLAGACQIVEQHGGSITVESVEGEGATFTVRLPLDG